MQTFGSDSIKLERQLHSLVETYATLAQRAAQKNLLLLLGIYLVIVLLGTTLFFSLTVWFSPLATAISLSGLLLALFGGYIYHRYASLHRPAIYQALAASFIQSCSESVPYRPGTPAYHSTIGMAAALFADFLRDKEYSYLAFHWLPKAVLPLLENPSAFLFWRDLFLLREVLLQASIHENLHLVRTDPIHLTYHSQLANAYVLLSRLYRDPRLDENRDDRWIAKERSNKKMEEKYRQATEKAIEEFKIISSYAPDDPWVLSQLAISYRDLGLPFEEIHACEALLRLCPGESEILHRLGSLYFKLGANAKGLEVYRQLCHIDCTLAGLLIAQYGNN